MLWERRRVAHLRVSILCKDSSIRVGRALTRALAATVQCAPEPQRKKGSKNTETKWLDVTDFTVKGIRFGPAE